MNYHLIYGVCECYVWTIAAGFPFGRCGRCHVRPETFFGSKREAVDEYFRLHSRYPRRLNEEMA